MDSAILQTIVTASAAVSVGVAGLGVNAFWISKSFDQLKGSIDKLDTSVEMLTGSMHDLDKRLSVIEDRIKRP